MSDRFEILKLNGSYVQSTCMHKEQINNKNCTTHSEHLDIKRLPKPISKLCSRILQFANPLFINKDINLPVNYDEDLFIWNQRSETLGQLNSHL